VNLFLKKLLSTLEVFSSVVLFVMMILTFVDVIGRYVFSAPIFGASEMISGMLAVLIFAGLGITNARDEHIVVELMDHRFRRLSPKVYDIIIQVFSVIAMCIITYVLAEEAISSFELKSITFVLEMPLFYVAGLIALLSAISVFSMLAGIFLRTQNKNKGEA